VDLELNGPLDLMGTLDLSGDGGKVKVNGKEALVEGAEGQALSPVIIPTPPASPSDPGLAVKVITSLGKTVKAGQVIVTSGMVLQGNTPTWPGMLLPSASNAGPTMVTANGIPVNVLGDKATIFPNGGSATLGNKSGQG
jgi:hypothetical protein